jgi:hypothetical protein
MDLRTGKVLWSDASSETTKVERRAVAGIVAEMSHAAEDTVEHLVSSMQSRVIPDSASLQRKETGRP